MSGRRRHGMVLRTVLHGRSSEYMSRDDDAHGGKVKVACFLRAAGGMMRSMARDRYPSIAVAPQARVLLLVRLAHLTVMATPFHRAMLEGGQDHPIGLTAGGNGLHREPVTAGDRAHADCALQWATSPQVSLRV